MTENDYYRYTIDTDGESIICECGNTPFRHGFTPCLPDGDRIEPTEDSGWDMHYICEFCGLVHAACRAIIGDYCDCPACSAEG